MADKKVSELDAIAGSATAADDLFLIVDASGSVTKKITRAELNNAIEQDVLSTVDINGGTIDSTVIGGTTPAAGDFTTLGATGNITVGGTVDGRDVAADGTKLDGIEAAATADQTDAEIRAAVEAASDSNVFTDADHTKLNGIEASADVTDATNVAAAGALMTSGGALTGDISFPDNEAILMGAGNDLKIFHNGSNSQINDLSTGNLQLLSNGAGVDILKTDGEVMAKFITDGAVELYHDNAKKLATSSTGATIGDKLTVGDGAAGEVAFSGDTGIDGFRIHNTGGNYLEFRPSSTDVPMVLNNVGNVGIGHTSPTVDGALAGVTVPSGATYLHMHDTVGAVLKLSDPASGANRGAQFAIIGTDAILNNCESGTLIFGTGNTERGRFNSAGALLIGKTSDSISNNGISAAGSATGGGHLSVTNDGNSCVTLNRKTSDGTIMSFATDGSTGGSIGVLSDRLCVGQSDVGLFFDATNNTITPFSFDTFDTIDNHIDLGIGSRRFQDIFASNGTIQTSDENEKQNIASLTSTEITAAKAISALFKTYKWKDAAASKGDAARTHTGVIAQEVQTVMSDAGLDAANYAFWCSDTWWETSTDVPAVEAVEAADAVYDDDGNEVSAAIMPVEAKDAYTRIDTYHTADEAPEGATQRTRMGIRYPELLAFIGAATEQRLTDIETRLTALEAN